MLEVADQRQHPGVGTRVLIVEDEPSTKALFSDLLSRADMTVGFASTSEEAVAKLPEFVPDVVLADLELPGSNEDGMALSRRLQEVGVPVVVVTGRADVRRAIQALRAGVADFLTKPVTFEDLTIAITRARRHSALSEEVARLRAEGELAFEDMLGRSRPIADVQDLVVRVAPAEVPVLITGESGTGKELVARAIHDRSHRKDGPFVAVNCAALPAHLLESELFGHIRGAFTDAVEDREGLFQAASGGTLFLDEVGEMPLDMQAKLLRAIQERKVRPVGGSKEIEFQARIVSATNLDIEDAVEEGRFRDDLYYRLNVVRIPIPPLRARGKDVLILAEAFIDRAARREGRKPPRLSQTAAERLLSYDWPGNVRELENCIEGGVALSINGEIRLEDLPDSIRAPGRRASSSQGESPDGLISMEELERRHIVRVLEATQGNKSEAARILGFDRRTLYRKAERYGLAL